jgi:uncharacterized protein (UPF0332 family)
MSGEYDLLKRALDSLPVKRKPKIVFLRRSVSDAYYAAFHALARHCADSLIGASKRTTDAWRRVYRGLDHGKMKEELRRTDVQSIDPAIQRIANAFIQLQEARHSADYDPYFELRRREDVEQFILMSADLIHDLKALPSDKAIDLAAILVVKKRI